MSTTQTIDRDAALNNNIKQGTTGTGASTVSLQTFCENIARQPVPDLSILKGKKGFPDVTGHLGTTKGHVNEYLAKLQPEMLKIIVDITGYSNQFTTFATSIKEKLDLWQQGQSQGRTDALALFHSLSDELGDKRSQAADTHKKLVAFRQHITHDLQALGGDIVTIEGLITADKKLAPLLKDSAEKLEKDIGGATAGVVISALGIGAGGLMILAGPFWPPLGLVGSIVVVGSIAGTVASAVTLAKLVDEKKTLLAQASQAQKEMTILENIKNAVGTVNESLGGATLVARNVENGWTFLKEHLDSTIADLDKGQSSDRAIVAKMWTETARKDWLEVHDTARRVQTVLQGVKVEETKREISGDDVFAKAA